MATDKDFIEFVVDQMSGASGITSRKMFGEYAIYCLGGRLGFTRRLSAASDLKAKRWQRHEITS